MTLCAATTLHLREMMGWFPDGVSASNWSGPTLRFPFTENSFFEDTQWQTLPSYSLVEANGRLVGFGQYYLRAGRCHLARLAISPSRRNQGLGRRLIHQLIETGCQALGVTEAGLFVLEHNTAAIHCYGHAGFQPAVYPGEPPALGGCLYMVRINDRSAPQPAPGETAHH